MKQFTVSLVNSLRVEVEAERHIVHTSEAGRVTHVDFMVGEEIVFEINGDQFSHLEIKTKPNVS